MDYKFSDRISSLQPSAIREILKVTADPRVISFAAGNPAADTFPDKEMAAIAADIFANSAARALQYGVSEGYDPLRKVTFDRLKAKFNVGREFDDLLIVSGGQQGIELSAKCFINEGDMVLCEEPSFIGALNALRSYGMTLKGVPCDEQGMRMDVLEEILAQNPNVKLIYTIPTFQNPSGITLPLERRKQMLALAEKYGVMILEDSPYFELRYEGEYVPPIKALDEAGVVIYCGSYSKTISPGIRLGFVCAPKTVTAKITVAKQVSDVHSNLFFQMLVTEYLTKYDFDAHIAENCAIYKAKRDKMVECLRKYCPQLKFTVPEGGLFLWCTLPEGKDGMELCRLAGLRGVAAVPGCSFMVDDKAVSNTIRLNFSLPTMEQLEKGSKLLGEALTEYLG